MSAEKIISEWKEKFRKRFTGWRKDYYIDKVVDHAEHHILDESRASFNLTVFYGRDAGWSFGGESALSVRRIPGGIAEKAQQMKEY